MQALPEPSEGEIGRGPTVGRKTGAEAAVSILARGGNWACVSPCSALRVPVQHQKELKTPRGELGR